MDQNVRTVAVQTMDDVADGLITLLTEPLAAGQKVLWLISGGSSIPVAATVSQQLGRQGVNTEGLFVTLVDDLYDPAHSAATNWQKLQDAGFEPGQATMQGILPLKREALTATDTAPDTIAAQFNRLLEDRLAWADVSIGQFGLGDGFHTGGVLAGSPAAREAERLAIAYKHDGVHKITVTPALIGRLDTALVNSMGEGKRPLVKHFLTSTKDIVAEPTQGLKSAKQTYLYSDVLPE
jgi:6-phosphogluconolactonase/glucosamine-6-phosphate isomerase/deaminase